MSAAALADLKARMVKCGSGAPLAPVATLAPAAPSAASPPGAATLALAMSPTPAPPTPVASRARAFDASEGTPLDPLLNKTYDLSVAHTLPSLDN
jgi:UPF0755 protein